MSKYPNLWKYLTNRNPDLGGVTTLGIGRLGSGKTNGLCHLGRRIFEHKIECGKRLKKLGADTDESRKYALRLMANEQVWWCGDEDCQWRRFPPWVKQHIFVERESDLHFYRNGQEFDPLTIPFDSHRELVKLAPRDTLNIVYMKNPHKFREFIMHLIRSPSMKWASVFVDEVENLVPGYEAGETWHKVDAFVKLLKRSRKRRVSLYTAAQVRALCDHRFTSLVMYHLFFPGARSTGITRVNQGAIDGLDIGQCWLATQGNFQKLNLPYYPALDDMVCTGLEEHKAPSPPTSKDIPINKGGERVCI